MPKQQSKEGAPVSGAGSKKGGELTERSFFSKKNDRKERKSKRDKARQTSTGKGNRRSLKTNI